VFPPEQLAAMQSLLVGCVDSATDNIMELISMVTGEPRPLTDAAVSTGIDIGPAGDGAVRVPLTPPSGAGGGARPGGVLGAAAALSPGAAAGVAVGVIGGLLLLGGGVGFLVGRRRGIRLGSLGREKPGSNAAAARAVGVTAAAAGGSSAAAGRSNGTPNLEQSLHASNMV
jgi:hypothetical protein